MRDDANNVSSFSDEQIKMLVRNTEELGCGLIMVGGPNSFGAGGWSNTELEKAMPVDFQIKSAKVVPVGALVLNMHASEIPQANYWQKVIAQEAVKALGPRDYCGLVYFGNSDQWLWGQTDPQHVGMLHVGPNRQMMLSKIDKMNIGDMPNFDPSMQKAAIGLAGCTDAANKHMILASDGDPGAPSPEHDQRAQARRRDGDDGGSRRSRAAWQRNVAGQSRRLPAASITSSAIRRRCRRFFSARLGGWRDRLCTSRIHRSAHRSRRRMKSFRDLGRRFRR